VKVLHVLAPAPFGGLEQVVVSLAAAQQAERNTVHVAELVEVGAAESAVSSRLRSLGVDVHSIASRPRSYRLQFVALRRAVEDVKPDVIHTHGYVSDVLGAMIKSVDRGQRLVSTVHGFTGGDWKNRLYERLQRHAFKRFDAVVAVSRRLSLELQAHGLRSTHLHTIPNAWRPLNPPADAVVARRVLGIPDDSFSVGWVGRLSHEKGLDVLLNALPNLADVPLRLTVVGDGRLRATLQRIAEDLGVAPRISWVGTVNDAARLMRAFDLLVISSRTEGTPMNLLEAMSAGVPVLATAVGGIPDVVSADEALLVSADDPGALAHGIRSTYREREGALQRAALARRRAESAFGVQTWVEAYDRVYASV